MKTPTIQEQYNLLKEGKGHKGVFMKAVRSLFPEYVNQYTSFDDAVNILKSKSVLNEGIGGLVTTGRKQDWHAIFNENISALKEEKEAKAEEKKPTKDVVDMETKNYNYEDTKNIDNLYSQEFLLGYYTEMKDPKNEKKTVDELKAIVAKNLAKDNQHYIKDGQFGVKGLGYTTDAPGLGKTKEVKGKYKSSGMEPVKLKESMNDGVEEMFHVRPQKGGGSERRFIPRSHILSKEAAFNYPHLIKLFSKDNSPEILLYISPKLPPAFASITRGRQDINKIPPLLKNLQDHINSDVINLLKSNMDNKTVMVNGKPMHKINLPISKTKDDDYEITTPYAAGLTKEDTIREFVSQMIKEIMNESPNDELEAAKDEARMNSEEGYVQHVNKTKDGYEVSDWYDDDTTVYSYENGEEINNREDMFDDDDDHSDYFFDIDTPEDEEHSDNYQWDDTNPDLRALGANPKIYETKLRSAISTLIKEELDMKEIEAVGEDAKVKAMTKKIDDEIAKHKKKLKALTTLTELEEDSVNPKKIKELTNDIKKLENVRKKVTKGKKKDEIEEGPDDLYNLKNPQDAKKGYAATINPDDATEKTPAFQAKYKKG